MTRSDFFCSRVLDSAGATRLSTGQRSRSPCDPSSAITTSRVYDFARQLASLAHRRPLRDAELRNQARRAAFSAVLNIAEGAGLDGRAGKRHFQIAKASALETVAAYELGADIGESVPLDGITRLGQAVAAMLTKLIR